MENSICDIYPMTLVLLIKFRVYESLEKLIMPSFRTRGSVVRAPLMPRIRTGWSDLTLTGTHVHTHEREHVYYIGISEFQLSRRIGGLRARPSTTLKFPVKPIRPNRYTRRIEYCHFSRLSEFISCESIDFSYVLRIFKRVYSFILTLKTYNILFTIIFSLDVK